MVKVIQQRPTMTKAELREAILDVLLDTIPANSGGPSSSAIYKSSIALDRIMQLIEQYLS